MFIGLTDIDRLWALKWLAFGAMVALCGAGDHGGVGRLVGVAVSVRANKE